MDQLLQHLNAALLWTTPRGIRLYYGGGIDLIALTHVLIQVNRGRKCPTDVPVTRAVGGVSAGGRGAGTGVVLPPDTGALKQGSSLS